MFVTLFRLTVNHIARRPFWSVCLCIIFGFLFLVLILGWYLTQYLSSEKIAAEGDFTYPIFLSGTYDREHPRVEAFIADLPEANITGTVTYISREQALDFHIKKDPQILSILAGENPFSNTLIVPLYGADIAKFWTIIGEYRDIFESVDTFDTVRTQLTDFEKHMNTLDGITQSIMLVMLIAAVLIVLSIIFLSRSILRSFVLEKAYSRETSSPFIFHTGPYILTLLFYLLTGLALALGTFASIRSVSQISFSPEPDNNSQTYDTNRQPADVGMDQLPIVPEEVPEANENTEPDSGPTQGE